MNFEVLICASSIILLAAACTNEKKIDESNSVNQYVEKFTDGTVKCTGSIDKITMDRVGYWEYFYEDGAVKAKGNYENGFKVNVWHYFRPDTTIDWAIYTDGNLGITINAPSTFRSYPNYNGSNVLAFVDTAGTQSFHVNFNISSYKFDEKVNLEDRIQNAIGSDVTGFSKIEINGRAGYEKHIKMMHENRVSFLSQVFVNSVSHLYLLNFFNSDSDTRQFSEIAYSIRVNGGN